MCESPILSVLQNVLPVFAKRGFSCFYSFALAALTAAAAPTAPKTSINDVKVGIRHGQVSFHIKGDTPISVKKVTANNGDRMMIVWIRNASLGQPTKTFRHRGVTVKAHQHTKSVEFDIMYRKICSVPATSP